MTRSHDVKPLDCAPKVGRSQSQKLDRFLKSKVKTRPSMLRVKHFTALVPVLVVFDHMFELFVLSHA